MFISHQVGPLLAVFLAVYTRFCRAFYPDISQQIYYRWHANSNIQANMSNIYDGMANVTWKRDSACYEGTKPWELSAPTVNVTLTSLTDTIHDNGPVVYGRKSHGIRTCDAHADTSFTVFHHGKSEQYKHTMKIQVQDMCVDKDCKDNRKLPNVNCLQGPPGKVIMYRENWINECPK